MLEGVSYSFVISSIYVRYYPSIYLTSFTCTRPSIYLSILDFNHSIILIMSHSPSPNSLIPSLQMTEYFFLFLSILSIFPNCIRFFISLCLLPRHFMSVIVFAWDFWDFETFGLNPFIISLLQSLITVSKSHRLILLSPFLLVLIISNYVHKTDPLSGATKCVKIDKFCAKCVIFDNSVNIM